MFGFHTDLVRTILRCSVYVQAMVAQDGQTTVILHNSGDEKKQGISFPE
jgi:hypothetical protein